MDKSLVPSTGTAVKGGIKMDIGKEVLKQLKNHTNIKNIDITELNLELGSNKEAQLSGKNTVELFKPFLS
jgi:arginase family enzyme